ncbi:MAG: hypothetical protein ACTSV2_04875 [Candidatus Thorarchaeota archaeon]
MTNPIDDGYHKETQGYYRQRRNPMDLKQPGLEHQDTTAYGPSQNDYRT